MKSSPTDFERQTEILARCLNGENLSKSDYAEIYNVSEITINRDLKSLPRLWNSDLQQKK